MSAKAEHRVTLNLTEAQYRVMRADMADRNYIYEHEYLIDLLRNHLHNWPDDAVGRGGKRDGAGGRRSASWRSTR